MDERVTKSERTALQHETQIQTKDRRKEGGQPCGFGMKEKGGRRQAKNEPSREGANHDSAGKGFFLTFCSLLSALCLSIIHTLAVLQLIAIGSIMAVDQSITSLV